MVKKVVILGSTGTIGENTIKVIKSQSKAFEVIGLVANKNKTKLQSQAEELNCKNTVLISEDGEQALTELLNQEIDITICAITGIAGLKPALQALKTSKQLGLANKESIVVAGNYFLNEAKKHNCEILPIDSEHNSIYQTLDTTREVKNLTITASGGPFFNEPKLIDFPKERAIKHPNWHMGAKISVDSATCFNKALEIIETHYLFGITPKVLIHPESVIHSIVEYADGMSISGLYAPDMRIPIANVLGVNNYPMPSLDLAFQKSLNFYEPDLNKFPSIQMAYDAIEAGSSACAVLNAANEIAVEKYLNDELTFTQIFTFVEKSLEKHLNHKANSIEDLIELDNIIRKSA